VAHLDLRDAVGHFERNEEMTLVARRHLALERDNLFHSERPARKPDRNGKHSAAYQNAQRLDLDRIR
jgi:hypothetical protein